MIDTAAAFQDARHQLNEILVAGAPFERQGFPFGSLQLRNLFEEEVRAGSPSGAEAICQRASAALELARTRWAAIHRQLEELDVLRELAEVAGMDLARFDAKAGNPRELLLSRPVSVAHLDAVVRNAGVALATLREALPRYCVQQARALGNWARDARNRGEDVSAPTAAVGRIVSALHDLDMKSTVAAIAEARKSIVLTAASAPLPTVGPQDEAEILHEAHGLARRLHSSELVGALGVPPGNGGRADEPLPSPEQEIETLWEEVDRLVRERELAAARTVAAEPGPGSVARIAQWPVLPLAATSPSGPPAPSQPPEPAELTPVAPPPASATVAPVPPEPRPLASPRPTPAVASTSAKQRPPGVPSPSPLPQQSEEAGVRISFTAAYVPPDAVSGGARKAPRPARPAARRQRSKHRE